MYVLVSRCLLHACVGREREIHGCTLSGHSGGVPFLELRGTEGDLEKVINSAPGAVKFVEPDGAVFGISEIQADDIEAATWVLNTDTFQAPSKFLPGSFQEDPKCIHTGMFAHACMNASVCFVEECKNAI